MKIQVKAVGDIISKQGPKAAYSVFELVYSAGGRTSTKNIMEFSKEAFAALKDAQNGDWFDVTIEKTADGKYSNWTKVVPSTADGEAQSAAVQPSNTGSSKGATTGRGGWNGETPEERAARQVMIVRQSSLATAVNYYNSPRFETVAVGTDAIINVAKQFEAYVFGQAVSNKEPDLDVEID